MKPPIGVVLHLDERKLPAQVFERIAARSGLIRDRRKKAIEAWNNFGKPGRDPDRLGGVMSIIAKNGAWTPHMKVAQLRNHWDQVVGDVIAQHSYVDSLYDGVLTIRAKSQVWATQLTYMVPQLTSTIQERLQGLDIREVRVTGPHSHSFRRSAMGRRLR